MTNTIELGGKRFDRITASTVRHDFWLMAKAREAGVDQVKPASRKKDAIESAIEELLDRCIVEGHAIRLLSGFFVPEGMSPREWTPKVAEEIEEHLGNITDPSEKAQLKPLFAAMLIGFFESGLASLPISLTSSDEEGAEEVDEPETSGTGEQ